VTGQSVITVRQVCKGYGGQPVLSHLSFEVERGEVYGLLGGNGAGKSTALHVIAGLTIPEAGVVRIASQPGTAARRRMGVALQEPALYGRLTSRENLWFFAALYGGRPTAVRRRVDEVAALWDLGPHLATRAEHLSGGWRRRVSLAVAMVHAPDVLVLDEPTAGLDAEARYGLWGVIRRLTERGVTTLLTTHLFDEAEALCDRVGVLADGGLADEGTVVELRGRVGAAVVAEIEVADPSGLDERARAMGWRVRRRGGRVMLLLPARVSMTELASSFDGWHVQSLRLRPVGLEDAYFEAAPGARR
jgi:ABC-2 type transport system ATP-binding protein